MIIISILFSVIVVIVLLFIIIGKGLSTKPYKGPITDHFNGHRFKNPSGISAKGFKDVGKYMLKREKDKWTKKKNPFVRKEPIVRVDKKEIQYTFINHATFLLQINGLTILTDPIFSEYCSPVPLPSMRRNRPPGVALDLLPPIDIVLMSHNHYDHMDKESIQKIIKKWNPSFITLLGNKHTLEKMGVRDVTELDWWQSIKYKGLEITSTPTNHFSSRGTFDRNTSLWGGFVLAGANKKIYFLGDSGYSDVFKEIGNRLGPMDLSLIPIGAYMPRWFMSPIHISPEEAVQVHIDTNSKKSIAMHFGTFELADDNPERAIKELNDALIKKEIPKDSFSIIEEGNVYILE